MKKMEAKEGRSVAKCGDRFEAKINAKLCFRLADRNCASTRCNLQDFKTYIHSYYVTSAIIHHNI